MLLYSFAKFIVSTTDKLNGFNSFLMIKSINKRLLKLFNLVLIIIKNLLIAVFGTKLFSLKTKDNLIF